LSTAILIIVIIIMIIGALGTILPAIPGTPLIFGTALVYGIYEGFHQTSLTMMVILGLITILSILIDYFAGVVGAKKYGASKYGTWGAIIGGVIGIFFGIIGLFIGPFLGAVIGELVAGKQINDSLKIGFGSFMGLIGGSLLKFTLAVIMIIYFLYTVL
jgi:uncharacterized protein